MSSMYLALSLSKCRIYSYFSMCICVIVRLNLHLLCQTPATPLLAQSSGRTCRTSATSPSATTARRTMNVPLMGRRSLGVPLLLGEILVSHFDQDALVNNPHLPSTRLYHPSGKQQRRGWVGGMGLLWQLSKGGQKPSVCSGSTYGSERCLAGS